MTAEYRPDWRPAASTGMLQLRARIVSRLRAFLDNQGVLEVETPLLSHCAATDVHLRSLTTRYTGPGAPGGRTLYLHTSPEYPMKRLLAAGSGSIYQLCKAFRDGESGRLHNPEFTLLEWYQVGDDHHALMGRIAALVGDALYGLLDLAPAETITYREAFLRYAGVDPFTDAAALIDWAQRHGLGPPDTAGALPAGDLDGWRDLVLTHAVEPNLGRGRLVFVHDYPASQAALACVRPGNPPLAERFELYLEGVELANGYHELADAPELGHRFDTDLERRRVLGLATVPRDERLLAALAAGLPDCSGVAIGIDRLIMLAAGARAIDSVLAFPLERA